jgi:hypothetical protein
VGVSPVLVEPDGLTAPRAGARRSPSPTHWVSAAIVGVLAVTTLAIGQSGEADLMKQSDLEIIEDHLDAWYGGDFDGANALRAPERLRTGPPEERVRDEVEYQQTLGATTDVIECVPLPPSTIRCDVAYSNALNEAVRKPPAVVSQQFGVEDGRLLFVAGPYLEDETLTASFRKFANLLFPGEYEAACVEEPNFQRPACAEFKLAHLEDWASWHLIEEG